MPPHPLQLTKDQWVWYAPQGSDLFTVCRITKVGNDFSLELQDTKKNVTAVPYSILEQDPDCVSPLKDPVDGSDPGKYTAKDLSTLNHASLADIECCIRNQFGCGLLYTNIRNHVTLHINPNRQMDIYNEVFADRYSELDPNLPPHIYSLTALAYKSLCQGEKSQVIVQIGDTGSGKSQSSAHVLHFVTQICVMDDDFGHKCRLIPVILGAFVSALLDAPDTDTTRIPGKDRWASSRALSSVELVFDDQGFIVTASATVHFYERSRITCPNNGRNFDVFYFYVALAHDEHDEWIGEEREFRVLPPGEHNVDARDAARAQDFVAALDAMEIDKNEVFQALGAILMLSNIVVTEDNGGKVVVDVEEDQCSALGTDVETLTAILQQNTAEHTRDVIDRLMIDMYDALLSSIVEHINEQLLGEEEGVTAMTLVDIPSPAAGKVSSMGAFDSFVFNWMNDKVASMQVDAMIPPRDGIVVNLDEFEPRRKARAALQDVSVCVSSISKRMREMGKAIGDDAIAEALASVPVSGGVSRKGSTLNIVQANGTNSYDVDASFVYDARGGRSSQDVLSLVANSGCEVLIAGLALPGRVRGLKEGNDCMAFLDSVFSGELGDIRTVVNVRLNHQGSKVQLDRDLLLAQLRNLGIEAVINFNNAARKLSVVRRLDAFLHAHDPNGEGDLVQRASLVLKKHHWVTAAQIGESHIYCTDDLDAQLSKEVLLGTVVSSEGKHVTVSRDESDSRRNGSYSPLNALRASNDGTAKALGSPRTSPSARSGSQGPDIDGMHHLIVLTTKVEERLTKAIQYLNSIRDKIDVKGEVHELETLILEKNTALENRDYARIFAVLERSESRLDLLYNFQQGVSQPDYLGGEIAKTVTFPPTSPDDIPMMVKSSGTTSPLSHLQQVRPSLGMSRASHVEDEENRHPAEPKVYVPFSSAEKQIGQLHATLSQLRGSISGAKHANPQTATILHSELVKIENERENWRGETQRLKTQLRGLQSEIKDWRYTGAKYSARHMRTDKQQHTLRNALEVLQCLSDALVPHHSAIFSEEHLMTREQQVVHHFLNEVAHSKEEIRKGRLVSTECGLPWRP
eukprot:GEMP01005797.1.p1 GENE.GEMP01005797.1~~GEMP01005797.1.p1  ORF type:complete len:1085 (+),score=227.98 GEMP01005797.1:137-3391(+)